MNVLLARVSILSVCVLAVFAVPARGQPPANSADGAGAVQVTSRANIKVEIFGIVKLDAIYNRERPQAPGVPFFVVPRFAGGFTNHTFDINARQSLLGVLFTGPKIGNFQSGGRISAV